MSLLDLASAMATMYKEWHGNGEQVEIAKEQARKAEREKWKKYEAFTGNIPLKTSQAQMEAKGLAPVLFPHWVHRLYYDCTACHPGVFPMKRADSMTKSKIFEGRQCGVCHNGKLAFDARKNCSSCHIAGIPGSEKLTDPQEG